METPKNINIEGLIAQAEKLGIKTPEAQFKLIDLVLGGMAKTIAEAIEKELAEESGTSNDAHPR